MFSVARGAAALLPVLIAVLLAGCGASEPQAASASADRTITDAEGRTVRVPARPERVLPLSEPTLDATLALGLRPVGTTAGRGQNAVPAYLRERAKGVESVGGLGTPSLERVAALRPDLILLDGTAFQDAAVVDKLRKIAPTVYVSKTGEDWKRAFRQAASALGRADRAKSVLADYDARVASTKVALGPRAQDSVSIVRWSGIGLPAVLMKELMSGRVVTDVGLRRPPAQDEHGPGHSVPVSLEELEQLDADWMFFGALGGGGPETGGVDTPADVASAKDAIQVATDTPGFTRLKAYRAGHVIPVDGSAWTSVGGPLAARVVLDDLKRAIAPQ